MNAQSESRRLFLVQSSAGRDGSAYSALTIANGLRDVGWETHVVFGHEGPVQDEFRTAGHSVSTIPYKNWLRTTRIVRFARILWWQRKASAEFRSAFAERESTGATVVYVNTAAGLAPVLAARQLDLPCVWHIREQLSRDGGEMLLPRGLNWLLAQFARWWSKAVVTNTRAAKESLFGVDEQAGVHVVPIGISDDFFTAETGRGVARQALGLPADGALIGLPGGLRPVKGHEWFFEAVGVLLTSNPDLRVVCAGSGTPDWKARLEQKVAKTGCTSQVHFIGSVSDMSSFYRACDVVCIPSHAETFGRCAVESMACRVPVVASDVGGLSEIISNEQNGWLVECGDTDALRSSLKHVLESDSSNVVETAYVTARDKYSERCYQQRIGEIVESVCA